MDALSVPEHPDIPRSSTGKSKQAPSSQSEALTSPGYQAEVSLLDSLIINWEPNCELKLLCSLGSSSDDLLFNLLSVLTNLRCEKGKECSAVCTTVIRPWCQLPTGLWQRYDWRDLHLMALQCNPDVSMPRSIGKSMDIINRLMQHLTLSHFCAITLVFFLGCFVVVVIFHFYVLWKKNLKYNFSFLSIPADSYSYINI